MKIAHHKQCSDIIRGILRGAFLCLKQLDSFIVFSPVYFSKNLTL